MVEKDKKLCSNLLLFWTLQKYMHNQTNVTTSTPAEVDFLKISFYIAPFAQI